MEDNVYGTVGKEAADKDQIFFVSGVLCPVKHIKNDLVGRGFCVAVQEVRNFPYFIIITVI
jgi:hypothetical protein